MEVAGVSLSAVALASLFSTCLECFELFQTAKSLPRDFDLLLLRLDCQRERLLTWGELVGISKHEMEDGSSDLTSAKQGLVERSLSSIAALFSDTEKLQKEYGVESVVPPEIDEHRLERITSNRMRWFRESHQWLATHPNAQKQSSVLRRTKWAIRHKTKFEILINHIKEIVTDLHDILPISTRSQEEMVHEDIASMSVPGLHRIKKACSEEYQAWSDVASAIIMASEGGTIDHRSIGEWLQNASTTGYEASGTIANNTTAKSNVLEKGFELNVLSDTKFYFIFTARCFFKDSGTGCDQYNFGLMSLKFHGENFLPGPNAAIPTDEVLGKRITRFMDPKLHRDDVEMLRYSNFEPNDLLNAHLSTLLPLANVYIHCAPCVCAVRTALNICFQGSTQYLRYSTRVDDRISTICCPESTKMDRLNSLLNDIKMIEAADFSQTKQYHPAWIQYIDRLWIEQRVYQLEEDFDAQNNQESMFHRGEKLFAELQPESRKFNIIILGEINHCSWMLQTPPFPWKARIPKENEIYEVARPQYNTPWKRTYLGTYTPRAFKASRRGDLPFRDQSTPTTSNGFETLPRTAESPTFLNSESQNSREVVDNDSRKRPKLSDKRAPSTPSVNGEVSRGIDRVVGEGT